MTYLFLYKTAQFIIILIIIVTDDNTVSFSYYDKDKVVKSIETDTCDSFNKINWLPINLMKANPNKFKSVAI